MNDRNEKLTAVLHALPLWGADPVTCTALHKALPRPRIDRRMLGALLRELVSAGQIEAIHAGRYTYYRRYPGGLTSECGPCNTGYRINEVCPNPEKDSLYWQLLPLRQNLPAHLVMSTVRRGARKGQDPIAQQLVLIQTGVRLQINPELILISIVGSGAVLIHPFDKSAVGKLVLNGMPAKLAKTLMTQLHRVLRRI